MTELIAIEYRERRWETASALAHRVGAVAERLAESDLAAIGVAGLLAGRIEPLGGLDRPAVLFGIRAATPRAVVAVGRQLSMRGYSGLFTEVEDTDNRLVDEPRLLAGHGLVYAPGGRDGLYGEPPAEVRECLDAQSSTAPAGWPAIRMPGVDDFDRSVDGVYLEEAARREIGLVWVPGSGINSRPFGEREDLKVVAAREDTGGIKPEVLARWAAGDRVERGRVKLRDLADRPRRWLQQLTGLR